jgi:transcription elongation factor GreB
MSEFKIEWISREGANLLYDQYNQLVEVERPMVVTQVQNAAAEGDRSENAEYQYGKLRLRNIDQKIRYLKQRIDAIKIKDVSYIEDKVSFLSWVEYLDITDGLTLKTMHIVGPDELEHGPHRISYLAPFAKALLGKYVGEIVEIILEAGNRLVEIISVSNDPIDLHQIEDILAQKEANASRWALYLSTVTLLNHQNQKTHTFQIVSPRHHDLDQNKISYQMQMAKQILGKEIGTYLTVNRSDYPWESLDNPIKIEILDIQ